MDVDKNAKLQNNRDWMFNAYVTMGMSVGEISDTLNISKKLVLIRLEEFGLL